MRLLWINYTTKKGPSRALFLSIAQGSDHLLVMKTKEITPGDTRKIRANLVNLEQSSPQERLQWLKNFCPTSYRKAIRKLQNGKYKIIREYEPREIGA